MNTPIKPNDFFNGGDFSAWDQSENSIISFDPAFLAAISKLTNNAKRNVAENLVQSAENGDADAQLTLGLCYMYNEQGFPEDDEKAKYWLSQATESRNMDAMMFLGVLLSDSDDQNDQAKGFELLSEAAAQGSDDASFRLALSYLSGDGTERNECLGMEQLRDLAERDYIPAMVAFGELLTCKSEYGYDPQAGIQWISRAAEDQFPPALTALGNIFFHGVGDVEPDHNKAIKLYRAAAERDETYAMVLLGVCYLTCEDTGLSPEQFFEMVNHAAKCKNQQATLILAYAYLYGIGTPTDEHKSFSLLKSLYDSGSSDVTIALAECYLQGVGVERNPEKAIELFHEAAECISNPSVNSMEHLGLMYLTGAEGVEVNLPAAIRWLTTAVEHGSPHAMCVLSECYTKGTGVNKNDKKAFLLCEKAYKNGYKIAASALGAFYQNGIGVERDIEKAICLFKEAAENPDFPDRFAMEKLGACYISEEDIPVDYNESVKWFTMAAEHGSTLAMNILGTIYRYGLNANKDHKKAMEYFSKASNHPTTPNPESMIQLGSMYLKGEGVPSDCNQAIKWFNKAVECGSAEAMRVLGECYRNGIGVTKDVKKAFRLCKMSYEKGCIPAATSLGIFYQNGIAVSKNIDEAIRLYHIAAQKPTCDPDAMLRLAICYFNGYGVQVDSKQAFSWLALAAEKGSAEAIEILDQVLEQNTM